jgi:peptidoglycan/xylan/chitin deacetylase (PgdA/CDA1 family)
MVMTLVFPKPMRTVRMVPFLLGWLLWTPLLARGEPVKDYRPFSGLASPRGSHETLLVLRAFLLGHERYCLVLDPTSLRTSLRTVGELEVEPATRDVLEKRLGPAPYFEALRDAMANASAVQNAGLTRFLASPPGVALTVDLCPSQKPMDRGLFTELVREFGMDERPVPVAVAVTGIWMEKHAPDLEFLKEIESAGDISITWINHSYHHRWDESLPLPRNFLLGEGTDIAAEVLRTEAAMIERGLTPSVFFRFPGLVSDRELLRAVESFGLIPVGSDAWLAKNQWPRPGSIVLVHANGNEPVGVSRFLKLLREERQKIIRHEWLLLDLREATVALERKKRTR